MNIQQVKLLSPLDRLVYWIKERESIRLKKEAGASKPWTDDTILQSYRFCNVRRMDDKVSRWLLDNWYKPYQNHSNMVQAVALARFLNKPESLTLIQQYVFNNSGVVYWQAIKEVLNDAKQDAPIFNSAYMVRSDSGVDKVDYVIKCVQEMNAVVFTHSMEMTHAELSLSYGIGSFMAGQITADLRHAIKGSWRDKNTWAPIGPGSKRGMNRLHDRPKDQSLSQERFSLELSALTHQLIGMLPVTVSKRLEAIDFQNCLCEYDKYSRVLFGEGRPKSLYTGVA